MKNFLKLAGLIIALQFVCLQAVQANDAAIKQAMVKKYQLQAQGFRNADVEMLLNEMTSDFTATLPGNRTIKRAEFEAQLRMTFDLIAKAHTVDIRINKVTIEKQRVVVLSTNNIVLDLRDAQGHTHRYKENSTSRDIWVKVGNQWKIKRSESIRANVTVNGKPVKI